jgi:transglutaminase-like putative cysteine protease
LAHNHAVGHGDRPAASPGAGYETAFDPSDGAIVSIKAALHHVTHYRYDRPISLGPQVVRLRPAPHARTKVPAYALTVTPANHFLNWQQDPSGNWLARLVFPEKTDELKIEVDLTAEMAVINPFDFFVEDYAQVRTFAYEPDLSEELAPYLMPVDADGPEIEALLARLPEETSTVLFLVALNGMIAREIAYGVRLEPGVQTPAETLRLKSGSCRDSAWLLVQVLRRIGLAARFVSGYLIQLVPDTTAVDGPAGAAADFTDLHAWAEVYLPGAGWIGMDATSGLLTGEGHIPLAATPHYRSAAPISGVAEPAKTEFGFEMRITRVAETPRITKPYSEAVWSAMDALGERVDADLVAQDVRLTMGGEPTFVSVDDFEAPEWNIAAVGPTKRRLADTLIRRLRDRFGPGGLLHYGQGKWYPGESLPRWAFSLYWRKDGKPIWKDPALFAPEAGEGSEGTATIAQAQALADTLARRLGLANYVFPAFEDGELWEKKAAELPVNVTPAAAKSGSVEFDARIRRVYARGLGEPAGYVLPLASLPTGKDGDADRVWISEEWDFRRGQAFLVPGDSPLGFRLPLSSLPYVPPEHYPYYQPQDPLEPRGPLPDGPTGKTVVNGAGITGVAVGHPPAMQTRAPRWRSSPVTGSCGCSCRRRSAPTSISNSPPISRPPPPS